MPDRDPNQIDCDTCDQGRQVAEPVLGQFKIHDQVGDAQGKQGPDDTAHQPDHVRVGMPVVIENAQWQLGPDGAQQGGGQDHQPRVAQGPFQQPAVPDAHGAVGYALGEQRHGYRHGQEDDRAPDRSRPGE